MYVIQHESYTERNRKISKHYSTAFLFRPPLRNLMQKKKKKIILSSAVISFKYILTHSWPPRIMTLHPLISLGGVQRLYSVRLLHLLPLCILQSFNEVTNIQDLWVNSTTLCCHSKYKQDYIVFVKVEVRNFRKRLSRRSSRRDKICY